MSSATKAAGTLSDTPQARLEKYLAQQPAKGEVVPLTPDASTRVYFRVPWKRGTAVAAVYPDAFDETVQPYLDVTRLFLECNLPVPEILDVDGGAGIIIQEDLGDNQLCRVFETTSEDEREALLEQAIEIIARIQAATAKAFERDSICSRLAFDEAKLEWELNFFFEHYFGSYRKENLAHGQAAELKVELNDIAAELAARPRVMCHRDFHSFNLMMDPRGRLRIIDHQDARMGPATYDLVSLLLDRVTCSPSLAEIREHRLFLLNARERLNLAAYDPDDFSMEFRLMTVQRCLKACGTFSYQTGVRGRVEPYKQFINPMLEITLNAAEWLDRFPVLQRMIRERIGQ
ncbi:MAG TPA: phosphotransferase [Pyrinomonadaceae bacterium]|nr:phosphotransferase [Pyrinomonadaceae bacterium]